MSLKHEPSSEPLHIYVKRGHLQHLELEAGSLISHLRRRDCGKIILVIVHRTVSRAHSLQHLELEAGGPISHLNGRDYNKVMQVILHRPVPIARNLQHDMGLMTCSIWSWSRVALTA